MRLNWPLQTPCEDTWSFLIQDEMTHQITKMRSGRNVLWLCRGKQWYRWEFHLFLKVLACSKSFVSLSLLSDLSCFKSFSRPWFSSVISSICFAVLPFLFSLPLFLSIYFCLILHRYCFKLCFFACTILPVSFFLPDITFHYLFWWFYL